MTSDILEELRQRLLRDGGVQEMIRARAYEIFIMRGVQPGGPAQDWFQAESEVLAFLLANQSPEEPGAKTAEQIVEQVPDASSGNSVSESVAPKKKRKPRLTTKESTGVASKKTAPRNTGAKKSAQSESKAKRIRKKLKSEDETA